MKSSDLGDRLLGLIKNPSTYLAYCGLRRALKKAGQPLRSHADGFVIFVAPPGYRLQDYEVAAYVIIHANRENWGEHPTKVRLANPPKKKGSTQQQVTIFDLKDIRVLIAQHIGDVPKDVRFAALAILPVQPPAAWHINSARRLSGRSLIAREHAIMLARRPQNIMLAAVLKNDLSADDLVAVEDLDRPDAEGPDLFALPGYGELKPWAEGLLRDVVRWREGKLSWREVGQGALVSGPPGTGKTMFGAALANTLGFRLISTTVGAWQSAGHLDDTLNAMRKSFDDANSGRGVVLFIDEFDSIGTRSAKPSGRVNDQYWRIVINEFLSLLTRLGDGVVVIGATNHPEWIDPAILRAGRIERLFSLALPDKAGRAEILRYHAGDTLPFESLMEIAEELEGKTGAALEEMMRDARKNARDEDRELELKDLQALLPEKTSYTPEQLFRLAVHEAGHALVSLTVGYASGATIEVKDSFDPSADTYLGGLTSYDVIEDPLPTDAGLLSRIAVGLAGMAAEAVVFGNRSVGSGGRMGSDIERATSIARRMVGTYGLGKAPIFIEAAEKLGDKPLPEVLEIEVREILATQYERVLVMLAGERERVVALAADVVTHRLIRIERGGQAEAA